MASKRRLRKKCEHKERYKDKQEAIREAKKLNIDVYWCTIHNCFHKGHKQMTKGEIKHHRQNRTWGRSINYKQGDGRGRAKGKDYHRIIK